MKLVSSRCYLLYWMKRMGVLLVLSAISGIAVPGSAEEPELTKTWDLQGKNCVIEIKLMRFAGRNAVLEVYPRDGIGTPSVVEEAALLGTVLNALPKEGIDPQSLDFIQFRFLEEEAVSRVAAHVALSRKWRTALKTHAASVIYTLVTKSLNDSGAYAEWDRVLREHGLAENIAGVEKVMMEPFSRTHTMCPQGANCNRLLVPMDAMVQMNLHKIAMIPR